MAVEMLPTVMLPFSVAVVARTADAAEVVTDTAVSHEVAFEVADAREVTEELVGAGADLIASPTATPWESVNARLEGPGGLQLTVFQELGSGQAG